MNRKISNPHNAPEPSLKAGMRFLSEEEAINLNKNGGLEIGDPQLCLWDGCKWGSGFAKGSLATCLSYATFREEDYYLKEDIYNKYKNVKFHEESVIYVKGNNSSFERYVMGAVRFCETGLKNRYIKRDEKLNISWRQPDSLKIYGYLSKDKADNDEERLVELSLSHDCSGFSIKYYHNEKFLHPQQQQKK